MAITKCVICDHIAYSPDEQECLCSNPKYVKCELIHFMHEKGEFRTFTTKTTTGGFNPANGKLMETVNNVALNLCCEEAEKQRHPIVHLIPQTVTCKKCREFIDNLGVVDEVYIPETPEEQE